MSAARATILVYRGDQRAVAFMQGAPPVDHGEVGERVHALVEADRLRSTPWALEVRASGLDHDSAVWSLAVVLLGSGLAGAGFRVLATGDVDSLPDGRPW